MAKSLNRLLAHNVVTGCTMLINRALLKLASPIPKEAIMHDWWISLVASSFGKLIFLPKPTLLIVSTEKMIPVQKIGKASEPISPMPESLYLNRQRRIASFGLLKPSSKQMIFKTL